MAMIFRVAADALLFVHAAFVMFVMVGLLLILLGKYRRWHWVRNPWFRWLHLAAIGIVVLQAWLGVICPLTTWEMMLRERAGEAVYAGSFIAHWVSTLLYYQLPTRVFTIAYSLFGLLVLLSWYAVRPRPFGRRDKHGD